MEHTDAAPSLEARAEGTVLRIVGIDPGIGRTGVVVLDVRGRQPTLVHASCVETPLDEADPARLAVLGDSLAALLDEFSPHEAAIELLFFGRNSTTAMRVSQARGVALAALSRAGATIAEYQPATIKQTVTGFGGAPKPQVAQIVRARLGLDVLPGPDDVTDAAAIALCHAVRRRLVPLLEHAGQRPTKPTRSTTSALARAISRAKAGAA